MLQQLRNAANLPKMITGTPAASFFREMRYTVPRQFWGMKFLHMGLVILFIVYPSCLMALSWFLLVKPLNLPGKWRYLLLAVYFAGCYKDLLTNITGGTSVVAPEASYHVVTWMSTLNITVIISLFLAFCIHLGRLLWKISHRGIPCPAAFRHLYPVLTAVAMVLAVTGHVNAGRTPEIHKYTFFSLQRTRKTHPIFLPNSRKPTGLAGTWKASRLAPRAEIGAWRKTIGPTKCCEADELAPVWQKAGRQTRRPTDKGGA